MNEKSVSVMLHNGTVCTFPEARHWTVHNDNQLDLHVGEDDEARTAASFSGPAWVAVYMTDALSAQSQEES